MSDWSSIRFLESIENLKRLIKAATGRSPNSTLGREVSVCIQQGRLFFQSADDSALEIRPLLLFYGTTAFAKALTGALRHRLPSQLPPSHGLRDTSNEASNIENLEATVLGEGTFQGFNDVMAGRATLKQYGPNFEPSLTPLPHDATAQFRGIKLRLKDILGRIPELERLFTHTFQEQAGAAQLVLNPDARRHQKYWELQLGHSGPITNRSELAGVVEAWRRRFPILRKWRLQSASTNFGSTTLVFCNVPTDDEFGEDTLKFINGGFSSAVKMSDVPDVKSDIREWMTPPGGSRANDWQYLVAPLDGHHISDLALHFAGMFLLSSLVRYRPAQWVHVVTRSLSPNAPADDHALALIEKFMTIHVQTMKTLVTDVLNPTMRA